LIQSYRRPRDGIWIDAGGSKRVVPPNQAGGSVVRDEPVSEGDDLSEFVLELYPARACVRDSKRKEAVSEIDHVGRLDLPGIPDLEPFDESIHHLRASVERAAEAKRLLAGIELELDVGARSGPT
jgi:hypothetical protein